MYVKVPVPCTVLYACTLFYWTKFHMLRHAILDEQWSRLVKWKFWPLVQTKYFLTVLCHGLFWCPGVCQWTGPCWHGHWINTRSHDWNKFVHVSWTSCSPGWTCTVLCIKYSEVGGGAQCHCQTLAVCPVVCLKITLSPLWTEAERRGISTEWSGDTVAFSCA